LDSCCCTDHSLAFGISELLHDGRIYPYPLGDRNHRCVGEDNPGSQALVIVTRATAPFPRESGVLIFFAVLLGCLFIPQQKSITAVRMRFSNFMKTKIITGIMTGAMLLAGCGKKSDSSGGSPSPAKEQQNTALTATPAVQPALNAWERGDKSSAVSRFLETDWSARPLFTPGSTLSLSEDQFKSLSEAERQAKSSEMMPQIDSFKRLAAAVAQAGVDAASKGDSAQARKYFSSLKQCGEALDSPDSLALVKLVGQAIRKKADTELSKLSR
jgi:hypothetical protein